MQTADSILVNVVSFSVSALCGVVSSDICGRKFPEIYSNVSRNLLTTYVNQLLLSPTLQSDAVK